MLVELGKKHKTDKVDHRYLPIYERKFDSVKADVKKILEIGVAYGSSMRMWKEYFPGAMIYGIDIHGDAKKKEEDRIKVFIGDQSDEFFLASVISSIGGDIDIIIDDGSHNPEHQIKSFTKLFPFLKSGGTYIVEDCYPGLFGPEALVFFRSLIDHVFYWDANRRLGYAFGKDATWFDKNIISVEFYRFLVLITKGDATQATR